MLCYSGPNNRRLSEAYLEMMSHNTPHVGTWEFSVTEPWEVLSSLLETCCQEEQEDTDQLESSGAALGLQFLVLIFRLDLENYLEHSRAQNKLAGDYRPLLARVLCPSDSLGWCGRMKQVCRLYSRAVAQKVPGLPSLRCLVGLTGQLLQLKERTEDSNTGKVEMARYLAAEFHPLDLSETDLWAQLYLLEPAWLSALVSREMLSLATNIKLEPLSLRPIINNFLEVIPNADSDEVKSEVEEPLTVQAVRNNNEEESETKPAAKSSKSDLPAKTKPIDVHKKNKHGETALHTAAKKGNIVRMKECLETPGVDINCVDNNGYTPLSEAISHDRLEIVRLLLNHRTATLQPISNFLTPVKATAGDNNPKRNPARVDLFIKNTHDQSNAFHEAVELGRVEIVKLILESLEKQQPTRAELFEARNGQGKTVMKMTMSEEMNQLLAQYSNDKKVKPVRVDLVKLKMSEELKHSQTEKVSQVKVESNQVKPSKQVLPRNSSPLIELSINKYVASHSLGSIYTTFKTAKLEDLLSAVNNDPVEVEEKSAEKIEFAGGFQKVQFGVRPRSDLYRSETVKVQDLRDYDKLISMKYITADSPIGIPK